MTFKQFTPGEQVNIVRGGFKGNSATVKEMDPITGRLKLVAANGVEIESAQLNVSRIRENKDPNPEVTPEIVEEVKKDVKAKAEVKLTVCPCGCGILANKGREFRSGHDQTHKGHLIDRIVEGDKEAEVELLRRHWRTEAEVVEIRARSKKVKYTPELEKELANLI